MVDVSERDVDDEFREVPSGLIARLAAKGAPRKVPNASECRFCPIGREYCPETVEP